MRQRQFENCPPMMIMKFTGLVLLNMLQFLLDLAAIGDGILLDKRRLKLCRNVSQIDQISDRNKSVT